MTIQSLIRLPSLQFQLVEVEVALIPGLPQIHVLGLPDAHLKESMLRIRAALRARRFKLPRGQQVLVQVRPSYVRKSSRGLDLALAAAIAFKMEHLREVELNLDLRGALFYGELALDGRIHAPADLEELGSDNLISMAGEPVENFPNLVVTGRSHRAHALVDLAGLEFLDDLTQKKWTLTPARLPELKWERPEPPVVSWPQAAAETLEVVAVGEHSALVCGPRGSGKTTWMESVPSFLSKPEGQMAQDIRRWQRKERNKMPWRPFVRPHHSTSARGLIGGGVPLTPGEMTRAHGGVLFLDELLEFEPLVQDALREPLDHGRVTLRRGREWTDFPADFLLLAATNLCPCGNFVPRFQEECACTTRRIRHYAQRLSGPLLDRLDLVQFSHTWIKRQASRSKNEVEDRVGRARQFRTSRLLRLAGEVVCNKNEVERWMGKLEGSRRRERALSAVARTLADLDQSELILGRHYQRSFELTVQPLDLLFRSSER